MLLTGFRCFNLLAHQQVQVLAQADSLQVSVIALEAHQQSSKRDVNGAKMKIIYKRVNENSSKLHNNIEKKVNSPTIQRKKNLHFASMTLIVLVDLAVHNVLVVVRKCTFASDLLTP